MFFVCHLFLIREADEILQRGFFFEEILECLSLEMINLSEQDLSS